MFNSTISNTYLHERLAKSITSPGVTKYSNIEREESYIRSLYPVTEFDVDQYIRDTPGDFIIKTASIGSDCYERLVHEIYITLNISNSTTHSQKIRDVKITDTQLCVIFEYVKGDTLFTLIDKYFHDLTNLNNIIDTIICTIEELSHLYSKYQFTHYDLHSKNVMVNKNGITIIDVEMSHIVIDNEHYGITLLPDDDNYNLVTPNYYWPFDLFKLIGGIKRQILNIERLSEEDMNEVRALISEPYNSAVEDGRQEDAAAIMNNLAQAESQHKVELDIIKSKLRDNKLGRYIDTLLAYFIIPQEFEQHTYKSPYIGCTRLDLIPQYHQYLTHFDHFYQYCLGINNLSRE